MKKTTIGFLCAILLTGARSAAEAAEYPVDVIGHWAKVSIRHFVAREILSGYPDGRFHPDRPVTRAETGAMLVNYMDYKHDALPAVTSGVSGVFSDVLESDWSSLYIVRLHAAGYVNGYPDGKYLPERNITRQEFASLIYRYLETTKRKHLYDVSSFPDVTVQHFGKNAIQKLAGSGILSGYPDGSFHPEEPITRAQAAAVLAKLEPQPLEEDLEQKEVALTSIDSDDLIRAIRRHRPYKVILTNYDPLHNNIQAYREVENRLEPRNASSQYPMFQQTEQGLEVHLTYHMTDEEFLFVQRHLSAVADAIRAETKEIREQARMAYDYTMDYGDYAEEYLDTFGWDGGTSHWYLKQKRGVCAGYADFYSLLLDELGIPNSYVHGYADEESKKVGIRHAWVRLYIEGEAYDADPTMDDVTYRTRDKYFLTTPMREVTGIALRR